MNSERFKDKKVLITGGNSGIGKSCALLFAQQGAKVTIIGTKAHLNDQVSKEISQNSLYPVNSHVVDVSVEDDVKKLFPKLGELDILINNAGITGVLDKPLHECDYANWQKVLRINLDGIWLCMKYGMPLLIKSNSSAIVNISSIAGLCGRWLSDAYVASKHGLIGLTRSAARQYAQFKVRINVVCPGPVDTPLLAGRLAAVKDAAQQFVPMERCAEPQEIANMVTWLCSNDASYITGGVFTVDGGATA